MEPKDDGLRKADDAAPAPPTADRAQAILKVSRVVLA